MSAETAFIDAVAAHLAARLAPAAVAIGAIEPVVPGDLPGLVISLPELRRLGAGLGERSQLVTGGALPVTARIDLANPVLTDEPAFRLLSDDRRTLILPHGGWVQADGGSGTIGTADLQVSVAGAPRTVVDAPPGPAEVRPDAAVGTLLFGAALPAAGQVLASYRLGQWERRVTPIAGLLQIDVRAAGAVAVQTLSTAVVDALDPSAPVLPAGLRRIALAALGAVGAAPSGPANSRRRLLAFAFEYDHQIDRPDSSGGVIRRIPIQSRLASTSVGAEGAIAVSVTTEFSEVPP